LDQLTKELASLNSDISTEEGKMKESESDKIKKTNEVLEQQLTKQVQDLQKKED